jgi:hypothetical protein
MADVKAVEVLVVEPYFDNFRVVQPGEKVTVNIDTDNVPDCFELVEPAKKAPAKPAPAKG